MKEVITRVEKIYLIIGTIFEAFVLANYFKDEVSYTKTEIIVGDIIDIIAWPVVLLVNIVMRWRR